MKKFHFRCGKKTQRSIQGEKPCSQVIHLVDAEHRLNDGPPNTLVLHCHTQLLPSQARVPAQGVHIGGLWSALGTVTLSRGPTCHLLF